MRVRNLFFFLVALATFFIGAWLLRRGRIQAEMANAEIDRSSPGADLFRDVFLTVQNFGVDSLSDSTMYRIATIGVLTELGDPYAALIPARDSARAIRQLGAPPVQGVYLDRVDGFVEVVSVIPGSPGARSGIRPGDAILRVGDTQIESSTPADEVARLIDGPSGTSIRVLVVRGSATRAMGIVVKRAEVPGLPAPTTSMVTTGIVAVKLSKMDAEAVNHVRRLLGDTKAMDQVKGMVLDLRGVVEGSLEHAVALADLFLDSGKVIVNRVSRDPRDSGPIVDHAKARYPTLPLVVLVNQETAGPAEVVAGALQDHDRAALVGEATFGRGVKQSIYPIDKRFFVRLSTTKWNTPSGRTIQRDTMLDERPTFTTGSGRKVYGGGGIVPDREIGLLNPGVESRDTTGVPDEMMIIARAMLLSAKDQKALIDGLKSSRG